MSQECLIRFNLAFIALRPFLDFESFSKCIVAGPIKNFLYALAEKIQNSVLLRFEFAHVDFGFDVKFFCNIHVSHHFKRAVPCF